MKKIIRLIAIIGFVSLTSAVSAQDWHPGGNRDGANKANDVIKFYEGNGGTQKYLFAISTEGAVVNWATTLNGSGVNDEARSVVLIGVLAGTTIKIFNEKNGDPGDDWTEIYVKKDIPYGTSVIVNSFEDSYTYDEYINVTSIDHGTIDGKVSYISVRR